MDRLHSRPAGCHRIRATPALVLNELPGQRTRLLVRTRANYSPRAFRFLTLPLGLFDATYGVAQRMTAGPAPRRLENTDCQHSARALHD